MNDDKLALVRLLQLASPALPIGAYSYSQGLESAVEAGTVHDAVSAQRWIGDLMVYAIGPGEAAVLCRCMRAVAAGDCAAFVEWNAWFRASRETAELRAETEQTGAALIKLLGDLELLDPQALAAIAAAAPVTLPAAFALAAHGSGVDAQSALTGYVWSWLENQVLAAMKSMPLGQVGGQRLLQALGALIPAVVAAAMAMDDADVGSAAPGLALASARHETQYSRLFRS
jgi:urease accessory protein